MQEALSELTNRLKADPKIAKRLEKAMDDAFTPGALTPKQVKQVAAKVRERAGQSRHVGKLDTRPSYRAGELDANRYSSSDCCLVA